MRSGAA
jgi:hypothetical protein